MLYVSFKNLNNGKENKFTESYSHSENPEQLHTEVTLNNSENSAQILCTKSAQTNSTSNDVKASLSASLAAQRFVSLCQTLKVSPMHQIVL